jgi:hypothetical protein
MSWRDDPEFERELTVGLERLAPRPRRDAVQRLTAAVGQTEQRHGWRLLAARTATGVDWSRLLAIGGVAAVALALGIVIGTSGILPQGSDGSPTPQASASGPAGWQEPDAYTFVMVSSCGERSLLGRFRVTVVGGMTTGYEALDEQAALFSGPASNVPGLGEMLRLVAEARDGGVADVSLVNDPDDGHPTEVSIDWLPDAMDDEECYVVSDYAPAPSVPSAQPTAVPATDWGSVTIQPPEGPGDIVVNDGLAWDGGAVLTGQLSGPLAEERNGVEPLAWFSRDGVSWLPASVELPPDGVTAFDIGPVFQADDRLLAFGNGRTDATGDFRPVLFESTDHGASWHGFEQPQPTNVSIADAIAFGDGYVAVGYTVDTPSRVVIMTSADGLVWDDDTPQGDVGPLYGSLTRLATDGSVLVATGPWYEGVDGAPAGASLTSIDGRQWTVGDPPEGDNPLMVDITYHASSFIAVGSADGGPAVWWSGDGFSWRRIELPAAAGVRLLSAVASTGDAIVAVGDRTDNSVAWRSTSGQRWDPPQRLGSDVGIAVLLRTDAGLLAAGTTTARTSLGKQPVAWITPPP